jgi:hypothetical protein
MGSLLIAVARKHECAEVRAQVDVMVAQYCRRLFLRFPRAMLERSLGLETAMPIPV